MLLCHLLSNPEIYVVKVAWKTDTESLKLLITLKITSLTVFSVGFEVDVTEAKCQQHFAEAGNLREVNYVSQLDKLPLDETADALF